MRNILSAATEEEKEVEKEVVEKEEVVEKDIEESVWTLKDKRLGC